ncbi:hypothetical protein O4G98_11965 [Zoogloeaceae bacterium G21618-S1]|jgi:hypothetical protein|nr:hypothetical protein [Zoogloeaceae bacterium G21618-S1]
MMMKLGKTTGTALFMGALLVALSGCQKQEGPVEQAGKEVDKAMESTGQQIEKAGDAIKDAATADKK